MVAFILFCILLLAALCLYGVWLNARDAKAKAARLRANKAAQEEAERILANKLRADARVRASLTMAVETGYEQTVEDKIFEAAFLENWSSKIDKYLFTAVVGVTDLNQDGTDRQELISHIEKCDEVRLHLDYGSEFDSRAVKVINLSGKCLGYLKTEVAAQVAGDFENAGRVWMGMARRVSEETTDRPNGLVLIIFRLSEQWVKDNMPKVSNESVAAMAKTGIAVTFMTEP